MEATFARRLENARKIRCLSQRGLCNAVNKEISSSAISKYEKGKMMPSSTALIALSKALDMNIEYFFRPFTINIDPDKFEFRKKSSMGNKKVDGIKYAVCSKVERYLEIESILGIHSSFKLDFGNTLAENENDAKVLATRLREKLNVGSDAITSAIDLLESIGIKVIEIEYDSSFSGTCNTAGDIPIIVVNKSMGSERKRLTIFHELGHLLMHCAEGVDKERMCSVFANEVLIPADRFKRMIGESRHDISLVELQAIQREYGISVDALMMKACQLNVITKERFVTFHKKKNALPDFKMMVESSIYPEESTNRFECLVYRALASEVISVSKAAALLEESISDVSKKLNLM